MTAGSGRTASVCLSIQNWWGLWYGHGRRRRQSGGKNSAAKVAEAPGNSGAILNISSANLAGEARTGCCLFSGRGMFSLKQSEKGAEMRWSVAFDSFSFHNLSCSLNLLRPGKRSSLIVGCCCLLRWLSGEDKEFFLRL